MFNVIIGGVVSKCTTWHLFLSLLCPLFLLIFLWTELNWGLCVCVNMYVISSHLLVGFLTVTFKKYNFWNCIALRCIVYIFDLPISCHVILYYFKCGIRILLFQCPSLCTIVFTHYTIFFHNTLFFLYSKLFFKEIKSKGEVLKFTIWGILPSFACIHISIWYPFPLALQYFL